MAIDIDTGPLLITVSPQDITFAGVPLDTVVLTVAPRDFFSSTLVVYLDEYTGLNSIGEAYGNPGLILTITFPTIATPLNGNVLLDTLVITAGIVAIQPYQPHDTCELTNALNNLRLDGAAGPVSGDTACELSTLLNNIRTGTTHTPVGNADCSLSKLVEAVLGEYNDPLVATISAHYTDIVSASFADNDGQFNVTVGTEDERLLLVFISHHFHRTRFVSTVTYNGVRLTRFARVFSTMCTLVAEAWYLKAPDSGTNQVEIKMNSNTQWAMARVLWFSGINQDKPIIAYSSKYTNAVTKSQLLLGTLEYNYPLDFVVCEDALCALTPGASQTSVANGLVGDIMNGISHRNTEYGNLIFEWDKDLYREVQTASAFAHIGVVLNTSKVIEELLDLDEPTDDCTLAWTIYDVLKGIRGTVH